MFRLILGHENLSAAGGAPQEGGPRSVGRNAQRRSAAGAHRASRSGAAATQSGQVGCRGCLAGFPDFQSRARDRTPVRTVGSGTGSLRQGATRRDDIAGASGKKTDHRHGLQRSARGPGPLDGTARCRRGGETTTGSESGQGNHSAAAPPRRSQAVAGKKCGTCRS
jgi:hypothetical protein